MVQSKFIASRVKKKPVSWDDLCTLAVLSHEATWGAAASTLSLTRNTVIRRIKRLELALGLQLVEDRQGSIVLTESGKEIAMTANEMADLAQLVASTGVKSSKALTRPNTDEIHGLVRISAPEGIAAILIAAEVGTLQRQYPKLRVDLTASSTVVSISHKQADIAVRLVEPTDSQLIALRAGTLTYSLYSTSTDPKMTVGYDDNGNQFPEMIALSEGFPDLPLQLRSNSLLVQMQAILVGGGRGVLPDYMARSYPELIAISSRIVTKPVWLAFHSRHRDTPRIRLVTAWLQALLTGALDQE